MGIREPRGRGCFLKERDYFEKAFQEVLIPAKDVERGKPLSVSKAGKGIFSVVTILVFLSDSPPQSCFFTVTDQILTAEIFIVNISLKYGRSLWVIYTSRLGREDESDRLGRSQL